MICTRDESLLISGSFQGNIYFSYLIKNQTEIFFKNLENNSEITSLALHPDQCIFSAAFQNGIAHFYDIRSKNLYCKLKLHQNRISRIKYGKFCRFFYSVGFDSQINIRDLLSGEIAYSLRGPDIKIMDIALSIENNYLICVYEDGSCTL